MKCKAKWLSNARLWRVFCPDCSIYATKIRADLSSYLPQEIAIAHGKRYHSKGE